MPSRIGYRRPAAGENKPPPCGTKLPNVCWQRRISRVVAGSAAAVGAGLGSDRSVTDAAAGMGGALGEAMPWSRSDSVAGRGLWRGRRHEDDVNENADVPGLKRRQTHVAFSAGADATPQTCLGTDGTEKTIRVATSDGRMFKIAGRPPAAPCLDGPDPPRKPPSPQSALLS